MRILLTLLLLLAFLAGCEKKPKETKPFKTYTSNIVIEQDEDLPTLGRQQTIGGVCFIKLKHYPICLQHEVRHCIEGNFHKGKYSDEDCFE